MSQTTKNSEKKVWVLVSSLKKTAKQDELDQLSPRVSSLVDKWLSEGKFVWSGPLDNNTTGMAVFEATPDEAEKMNQENKAITSNVLDSYLYEWEALPILSILN